MTENQAFSEEREAFLNHLQNITDIIQANQTEAVVVGGIALRAAMNKPVEFKRSNGTIPDIDMIGLGPNPQNIQKTLKEISQYQKSFSNCPPVGLEPIDFSPKTREKYPLLEMVSGIRKDDHGRYFLTFRSVEQEIDNLTMMPISRHYGQVNILTLPQETILHRYYTRVGFLKPKDEAKINEFCQHITNTGGDRLDPNLFNSYREFCQRINEKHPLIINLTKTFWNLDKKLGGKISGSNGFIYSLIGNFRR